MSAQGRAAPSELSIVQAAAFDHWWPKYRRLLETLIASQSGDSGRLQVPPPRPETLQREIHVGPGMSNRYVPGYTFYGVHTQGSVFEGLFLMDPDHRVKVLVNHDDPEDRKPIIEDAYVDHMNGILREADVEVDDPQEAVSLTRFFLSTFFNFTVHPEEASIDSTLQDQLQRVRVLSSSREIPQGRRALVFGERQASLVFSPVPHPMREAIRPPEVARSGDDTFIIRLFTWHPLRGEVRGWEIRIEDDQFAYFNDRTIGRWKAYRFEGMQ
ncbi:MAG: hypothetical protein H0V09_01855 [Gemmatimonadetes bacterium]|nr:hypothetical protein [Gemmatimonadota bacterium]